MDENKTFIIAERDGFSQKIGLLVSMLENARHYLKQASRNLSVEQLDAKPGGAVNSIGQLLAHLCAAEVFFQAMTFHDRRFNDQEAEE